MEKEVLLEVRNLSKTFGNRKVVNDLNLNVKQGEIYGFLGQNGAGKTTTIRMITGLIHPDLGSIKICGYDLKTNFKEAISNIGAIVEYPVFYSYLSAYDNLTLMANLIPKIKKERINEVLEIVGLKDRAKDKFKTYSLGMKQRLGIANALLNYPKLVILDEPTNGLDPQGIKDIKDIVIKLSKEHNITFFISSHLLHELEQICSTVGVIKDGNLVIEGDIKNLLVGETAKIEIYTSEVEKAFNLLNGLEYIKEVNKTNYGIEIKSNKEHSSEINKLLVTNDIPVESLIVNSNTLEEFFFDVTNKEENNV